METETDYIAIAEDAIMRYFKEYPVSIIYGKDSYDQIRVSLVSDTEGYYVYANGERSMFDRTQISGAITDFINECTIKDNVDKIVPIKNQYLLWKDNKNIFI